MLSASTAVNFQKKIYTAFKTFILFQLNYILAHWRTQTIFLPLLKKTHSFAVLGQNIKPSWPIKFAARALRVGEYRDSDKMKVRRKYRLCSEMHSKSLKDPSHIHILKTAWGKAFYELSSYSRIQVTMASKTIMDISNLKIYYLQT